MDGLDCEITDLERKVKDLKALIKGLKSQRAETAHQLQLVQQKPAIDCKSKATTEVIDYEQDFEWTHALRAKLTDVFKIKNFRLCQEA